MSCCNKGSLVLAAVAGGVFALLGAQAFSQNTTKDKAPASSAPAKTFDPMGKPPAEMAKYMENMNMCGQPGPMHAEMAKMVGKWDCKSTMWMMPDMPGMESTGTMTYKSIFGGRFIQGDFEGTAMMGDQKVSMQGMDITGYNNWTEKPFGFWIGSECSSAWYAEGTHDEATKTCKMEGKCPNFWASKGTTASCKSTMTHIDDTHVKMEMWGPGPDGKSFKTMEIMMTKK
ncbi:MAG TPA: DUF1579 domain-containing protein [Phycisphaerales bacterium]|nr:DUF1579 domain-containing protein [Phycisphaerales bacterium]